MGDKGYKSNKKSIKGNSGFTLIELLVVMSIISVISSMVLVYLKSTRDKARISSARSFSANIYHASGAYAGGIWLMEEGTGNIINDSSGWKNTATNNGATWSSDFPFTDSEEKWSLYFNGSSYLSVPFNAKTMNIKQDGFTYSAWIKPTALTQDYNMFMGQILPYFNVRSTGILHMSMTAGGQQRSVYSVTKLSVNKWYHVAATYDSQGYMKVYVDGKLDGTSGPFLNPSNSVSNFYIGKWQPNDTYRFTGYIARVRHYNNALSLSQIQQMYANESPQFKLANAVGGISGEDN